MTQGPVHRYLHRLEQELRKRRIHDPRLVEEVRAHLVDGIDEGRERGLSVEDAEREVFEKIGAPELVADQVNAGSGRMRNRFGNLNTVLWVLAPTVLTAVLTSVITHHFMPTRYRSETQIAIVPTRVPAGYVPAATADESLARLDRIIQWMLSRTNLERIINDFGLYQAERVTAPIGEVVRQMRRDIEVRSLATDNAYGDSASGFAVSVVSGDPRTAMRVTERLGSLIIDSNLREREFLAEGAVQFIELQIEDARKRFTDYEQRLEEFRRQSGGRALPQADVVPFEVLKERYKALLVMSEDARVAANLERRQIGERLRIIEPARLPLRPEGPSRLSVNAAGTCAGLALGLLFVGVTRRKPRE